MKISYLVHSTEDPARIKTGIERTINPQSEPEVQALDGHFGNKILHVEYHETGVIALDLFRRVAGGLTAQSKRGILDGISGNMDENSALYLRFDRQAMINGRLELGDREPIRMRVKPQLFALREGAEEFFRRELQG